MKKVVSLCLALIVVLSLCSCAQPAAPAAAAPAPAETTAAPAETKAAEPAPAPETTAAPVKEEAPAETAAAEPASEWPKTITDLAGNSLTFDAPVQGVVGTHNPTMNLAVVLGGGGKYIAGFGNKKMADKLYSYVFPELENDVVQIGKGKDINFETVASLGADLCILPERQKKLAADYENAGVPVAIVLSSTESFEAVRNSLSLMAQYLGEDERADEINNTIIGIEDKVASATASLKDEEIPSVMFLGSSSTYSVATSSMIQTEIMEKAGAKNAVTGLDVLGDFAEVSAEEIVGFNPDIIWIPNYASYTIDDVKNDDAFKGTDAVKNDRVYIFPCALEPWDYPTATCVLGLAWAAQNLHGDLYSSDDMLEACDTLYSTIYGRTFTAEEMGLEF